MNETVSRETETALPVLMYALTPQQVQEANQTLLSLARDFVNTPESFSDLETEDNRETAQTVGRILLGDHKGLNGRLLPIPDPVFSIIIAELEGFLNTLDVESSYAELEYEQIDSARRARRSGTCMDIILNATPSVILNSGVPTLLLGQ